MTESLHYNQRRNQRGISKELVNLCLEIGFQSQDGKVMLNRRMISRSLKKNPDSHSRKLLLQAQKKGGIVVVEEGGVLVTAYQMIKKLRRY